jgi:hypothetical protein
MIVMVVMCVWKVKHKVFVLIVVKLTLIAHSIGMMTHY